MRRRGMTAAFAACARAETPRAGEARGESFPASARACVEGVDRRARRRASMCVDDASSSAVPTEGQGGKSAGKCDLKITVTASMGAPIAIGVDRVDRRSGAMDATGGDDCDLATSTRGRKRGDGGGARAWDDGRARRLRCEIAAVTM